MDYELINNKELDRYEFHIDGLVAHVDYLITRGDIVYLIHTIVPPELEGMG